MISNHFLCKDWVHHPIDSQPFISMVGCKGFQVDELGCLWLSDSKLGLLTGQRPGDPPKREVPSLRQKLRVLVVGNFGATEKQGPVRCFFLIYKNHQTFQVAKMEVLSLIRLFWGWVFPYISRKTYSLYR